MVQYNEGLGAKTIHYEYDYKGNVKRVLYQKDKAVELFSHRYSYDANDVLQQVETATNIVSPNYITHANYSYYQTGELKRVNLAQGAQGIDYVYTLGGALKSINHPSLDATKDPGGDANDVFGITLDYYSGDYLRTGKNITTSTNVAGLNQDFNGNIKAARWANKSTSMDFTLGVVNQKGYLYNYNRNNWLTGATYGTTDGTTAAISPTANYTESGLTYDANGNIKTLQRSNNSGITVDNLSYNYTGTNRLGGVTDAVAGASYPNDIDSGQMPTGNYVYDAIGQLTTNYQENLYYFYNTQGLVTEVRKGSVPIVKFYYNERGQRIRKENFTLYQGQYVASTKTYYSLDLSGNVMAVYNSNFTGSVGSYSSPTQNDLPVYGLSRLGVYSRSGATSSYEITDHLGNVRAVIKKVSGSPVIQSYADYYPFGEQLPGRTSSVGYRYAFQGQELDGETGMEAFQLRLWDGRIGRWLSPDPYGQYDSPYLGMGNNPISSIDPDGGYSWIEAAWRYAAGGFKGDFHKSSHEGWGWGTTYENTTFKTNDGGFGIKFHHDFGQNRGYSNITPSGSGGINSNAIPCMPLNKITGFTSEYGSTSENGFTNWFRDHSSGDPLWGYGSDGGGDDRKRGKFGENYGGIDVTNMISSVGVSPTKNVALELGRRGVEFWDKYYNIKESVVRPLLSEGVKKDTFYYVNFKYKTHTFGVKYLKGQKEIDSVKLENPGYSTSILDVKIK